MKKIYDEKLAPTEDETIFGTLKIDPNQYGAQRNSDRISSTKFAVAGLLFLIKNEQSFHMLTATSLLSMFLGTWVGLNVEQGLVLFFAIGMVWVVEALNSAIEAIVDLASPEKHELAKVSKDTAAAATLLATIISGTVAIAILAPPIIHKLITGN
ncbi:diacylglycerol kinase family protein [Anaerolineales bacterium]